jgi:hypothetical protein
MPTVYRHLQSPSREQLQEEGVRWPRDNSYLRRRLDKDIETERSTMLIKTGYALPHAAAPVTTIQSGSVSTPITTARTTNTPSSIPVP